MTRIPAIALGFLALGVLPLSAQDLPPGLESARLLPGWIDDQGNRIAALELRLAPGWKTYWRSPGDSGLPPSFDWQDSSNLADITLHWPAPEAIRSGDDLTLGYHDLLVLPFTARPADPAQPLRLGTTVDFGLCEKICIPANVALQAPDPGAMPDPQIEAALKTVPRPLAQRPLCRLTGIEDGMRLSALLPQAGAEAAAMEVMGHPDIWVSSPVLQSEGNGTRATADFVAPSAQPFDLDLAEVRITLIGADGAVETQGCDPQG
ncbi:protein-disulfide reductase DsbD domain-containing protein [Paracoccus salsus]|uniref:protein-disulfide reductase DsbD domain-containing protein n=1 Tax=Paracoccus salsus TaxID=2911061 RepID=UPI001F3A9221|nr:protein-disulfide reductase DsbD domain-containing protein [Paracoccus salsus]MCF3973837.1 hypothetical protein [Paracoccus salsus]